VRKRIDARVAVLVAPAFILGVAAVSVTSTIDPSALRVVLLASAVAAIVAAVWRAAVVTRETGIAAEADVAVASSDLLRVTRDRRLPIFDRDTGAFTAWYFRLRVDEEIARADRFGERFCVISIGCDARSGPHVEAVAAKKLRTVDFAGNLGSSVAIVLPRTDREGAEIFAQRVIGPLKSVAFRISEYPADAATVDGLLGEDEWHSLRPADGTAA
jgi:hypothetical protein